MDERAKKFILDRDANLKNASRYEVPTPRYKKTIGIIGGMGSVATYDFFGRLIRAIPAEKEWDRPRIIIDNRCTMPSRVRAILYNENYDYVLACLVESTRMLLNAGADILVLACNTSHVFLEDIERRVPQAKGKFVNIIESLGKYLSKSVNQGNRRFRLLASERTIESKVYERYLAQYDVEIEYPTKCDYVRLRDIIEDVKQDKVNETTKETMVNLINESSCKNIIIGCTEFPIVYRNVAATIESLGYSVYDPLEATIERIKSLLEDDLHE